jgi:hydrogenase maturation protein HypF
VWGGEALLVTAGGCERLALLRPFPLPGGEAVMREPRRAALGLLWALDGNPWEGPGREALREAFSGQERGLLSRALERGVNAPMTSSVGRLFDAVAALCGLRQRTSYEAEAATALECAVDPDAAGEYELELGQETTPWVLDWRPALRSLLGDLAADTPTGVVAARFHAGLARGVAKLAQASGQRRVVLAGGCFANRVLLEATVERLSELGCQVDWPRHLPPGDGALAVGQLAAAARRGF